MIRNSEMSAQLGEFSKDPDRSIFFTPALEAELRPQTWNPTNGWKLDLRRQGDDPGQVATRVLPSTSTFEAP